MNAFFRNTICYRLTQVFPSSASMLADNLADKAHREPGATELSTYGFIPPFGGELVEQVNGFMLVATKKTERILPGSVVRDALNKKVAEIEERDSRKVYRKEKAQLKDEIVQTLLPQAFLRHKTVQALIMPGLIVVDTASASAAEDLLSALRECLGTLPVRPVSVKLARTSSCLTSAN